MSTPSSKHLTRGKETVLLVQAKPKYNFQNARKLPKEAKFSNAETPLKSDIASKNKIENLTVDEPEKLEILHAQTTSESGNSYLKTNVSRPVAVVGASRSRLAQDGSIQSKSSSDVIPLTLGSQSFNSASARLGQLPTQENEPIIKSNLPKPSMSFCDSSQHASNACLIKDVPSNSTVVMSPVISDLSATGSTFLKTLRQDENDVRIKSLEQERDRLKSDLEVQLQVNSELKRLLVASVGEDLFHRVEKLCRDRAQLSLDIGGFSKKLSEDYENLDKVSIQADMWRSKYLASRVMIEELGNARAYYSLQCHETQDALQQLLNERHELRTNLLEAYKVLQQVKTAFDPLNSHCSSSLRSTNVLELSRACQQLAEAMRFRLLPAHVAVHIDMDGDDDIWANSVTRAEQFAHEVLSRPSEPKGSLQSGSSRLLPLTRFQEMLIKRFHPHTRHENLTLNCCDKCKGEISVI